MSIINDALKKAEKIKEKISRGKGPELEQAYVEENVREKPKKRGSKPHSRSKALSKKKVAVIILVTAGIVSLASLASVMLFRQGVGKEALIPLPGQNSQPQERPSGELILTGIIHGEGVPMAVINGSVYMEGDFVKKSRIIKISEDSVILEKGGRIVELIAR